MKNPPWIKLYYKTLNSYPLCTLDDHLRFHAIGILLLASQCNNKILLDIPKIQHKLLAKQPIDIQALIDAEFIEVVNLSMENDLDKSTTDTEQERDKNLLKDCRVDSVNSGDNFFLSRAVSVGNCWFSANSSKFAWLWTDSQATLFTKGLEKSGYLKKTKKTAENLADEVAFAIFEGVYKETRPIEKAINAVLKSFDKGLWSTPKGFV